MEKEAVERSECRAFRILRTASGTFSAINPSEQSDSEAIRLATSIRAPKRSRTARPRLHIEAERRVHEVLRAATVCVCGIDDECRFRGGRTEAHKLMSPRLVDVSAQPRARLVRRSLDSLAEEARACAVAVIARVEDALRP